jgi:hypothetical protein
MRRDYAIVVICGRNELRRPHSGDSLGTRGKSFAAEKRLGEFKLAILTGALS